MNKSDQRTEQRPPRVYHRRIVLFVIGLEIFFASVMFIFYQSQKSLLISESDSHLDRLADMVASQLTALEQELYRRVEMINSNVMLQEYMFVVAQLEGNP